MFFKLTSAQIDLIRQKSFPVETDENKFLKSVVVNEVGVDYPDNILDITLSVYDGAKGLFKIFNNENAKKYMKLKIFEMLSTKMKTEIQIATSIEQIENIINNYGAVSVNLNASYDFVGDKARIDQHQVLDNGAIELVYKTRFILSRPKLDFLSLGVVFYFDKQEYLNNKKIEQQFIDEKLLYGNLVINDLYLGNVLISNNPQPVKDLRIIKSTFSYSSFLQSLYDVINSNIIYNKLIPVQNITTLDKFSQTEQLDVVDTTTTQTPVSLTKTIGPRNIPILKSFPKQAVSSKPPVVFSKALYSRSNNGTLGFSFFIDYKKIITNASPYKSIFERSYLINDIIKRCNISSINVLRREVIKKKDKYFPKYNTVVTIANSSEDKKTNTVVPNTGLLGSIKEININTGSDYKFRYFIGNDKTVFLDKAGFYQYGLELTINDGVTKMFTDLTTALSQQVVLLENYLEETNKIVTISKSTQTVINGSYDPLKDSFTKSFIDNFKNSTFKSDIDSATNAFMFTLDLFGLYPQDTTGNNSTLTPNQIKSSIQSLLYPEKTNAASITYFIKIYRRLIDQINRTIKNNYNNFYKLSYWFNNDYVDTSIPIKMGYTFLNLSYSDYLGKINTLQLNNRLEAEMNKYSNGKTPLNLTPLNRYLSPIKIFSKSKSLDFKILSEEPDSIPNSDYIDLEIDIKSGNASLDSIDTESITNKNNNDFTTALKSNKLIKPASINVKNSLLPANPLEAIKQKGAVQKNENINETYIMLALAKQYDITKGKFFPVNNNLATIDSAQINTSKKLGNNSINKNNVLLGSELSSYSALSDPNLPFQINLLIQNSCKLLNASNNYNKSLEYNSKFQFLFNTLHSVQILEVNKQTLELTWKPINSEVAARLKSGNTFLCRINNYVNNALGIEGTKQIQLPIYDTYFLLEVA